MGERQSMAFQLRFNGFLKVDFQGARITSDAGVILVRELNERLGFGELINEHISDSLMASVSSPNQRPPRDDFYTPLGRTSSPSL